MSHSKDYKSSAGARTLRRYLERAPLGSVLDIGCGDGMMLETVADLAQALAGVDGYSGAVDATRRRVPLADLRVADLEQGLPFPDNSFDTVLFCDVIEHLRQPVFALEEIARTLRRGGRLMLTTPNANSPFRVLRGARWFGLADPTHLIFYTMFSVVHLLKKTGLTPVVCRTDGLTGSAVDWLLRSTHSGGTLVIVAEKR